MRDGYQGLTVTQTIQTGTGFRMGLARRVSSSGHSPLASKARRLAEGL